VTSPSLLWPPARLRVIGSGLWLAAAGLTVVGSFMPLVIQREFTVSSWGIESDTAPNSDFPPLGIPLVVSAALLVVAGGLGLMSTRRHPASAAVLAARLLGTAGVAGIVAVTVIFIMLFGIFQERDVDIPAQFGSTIGLGVWLLLGACALAIAAIALMLIPKIATRTEPETPSMGIPVVRVLDLEFDEEPEQKG
jgi:hypothetical protein